MDWMANTNFVGGNDGAVGEFHGINLDGGVCSTVQRLQIWAGEWKLEGIRVDLTDGRSQMFGHASGPMKEFIFSPGERITALSLWGNGSGTRTGAVKFETNYKRSFDHGMTLWGRKTEYASPVGSGIFVGIYGTFDAENVHSLRFLMLRPVAEAVIDDYEFPAEELEALSASPKMILDITRKNDTDAAQTATFSEQYTTTSSDVVEASGEVLTELTYTRSLDFKLTQKIVLPPRVGEDIKETIPSTLSVKLGGKASIKHGWTNTETSTHTYSANVAIPARKTVRARAVIFQSELDLSFMAKLSVKLDSGATFKFPLKGRYKGVRTSNIFDEVVQSEIVH
jgi:hypothetical protein